MNQNATAQLYVWPIVALLALADMARERAAAEQLRQSMAAEIESRILDMKR